MKKINNYFLVAALAVVSLTFGCKEDEEPTPAANGSATISGIVRFSNNLANDTVSGSTGPRAWEAIPAGLIEITASINTGKLVSPTGPTVTKTYRTTVNTDGTYSITVDANAPTVTVTLNIDDFRTTKTVDGGSITPGTADDITTTVIFGGQSMGTVDVVSGDAKIVDADIVL
jgi:hypothetical protein